MSLTVKHIVIAQQRRATHGLAVIESRIRDGTRSGLRPIGMREYAIFVVEWYSYGHEGAPEISLCQAHAGRDWTIHDPKLPNW